MTCDWRSSLIEHSVLFWWHVSRQFPVCYMRSWKCWKLLIFKRAVPPCWVFPGTQSYWSVPLCIRIAQYKNIARLLWGYPWWAGTFHCSSTSYSLAFSVATLQIPNLHEDRAQKERRQGTWMKMFKSWVWRSRSMKPAATLAFPHQCELMIVFWFYRIALSQLSSFAQAEICQIRKK